MQSPAQPDCAPKSSETAKGEIRARLVPINNIMNANDGKIFSKLFQDFFNACRVFCRLFVYDQTTPATARP